MAGDAGDKKGNIPSISVTAAEPSPNQAMETEDVEDKRLLVQKELSDAGPSKCTSQQGALATSDSAMVMDESEVAVPSTSTSAETPKKLRIRWPNFCTFQMGDKEVFYFKAVPVSVNKPMGPDKDMLLARKMFFINLFENVYEYVIKTQECEHGEGPEGASTSEPSTSRASTSGPSTSGPLTILPLTVRPLTSRPPTSRQPTSGPVPRTQQELVAMGTRMTTAINDRREKVDLDEPRPAKIARDLSARFDNMQIDPDTKMEQDKKDEQDDEGDDQEDSDEGSGEEEVYTDSDDDSSVESVDYENK